jgi:hypothetical protein
MNPEHDQDALNERNCSGKAKEKSTKNGRLVGLIVSS